MAEREIAGMVEKSMGAGGGDVTPEEDSFNRITIDPGRFTRRD